tara:strand:- start:583 stop:1362 length:780 start_codon:yes stop_codon:yes gene_type:complete
LWDQATSKIKWYDNAQACFGDQNDLQIYHSGDHSFIQDTAGTGSLIIDSNNLVVRNAAGNETVLQTESSGGVWIYYNNDQKIETTGAGVSVYGGTTTTGLSTFASIELDSTLVDIHGQVGAARSVLTSTGAGVSWGNINANVFIGDDPPSSSVSGDLWWESDTGALSIRYEDTDSQQWVTITPGSSTFAVPSGGIIIWSGAANAIPTGWVLCDGTNSTPNLRDKFIIGAGNSFNVNDTGTTATGTGGIQYYSLCYIMKS